MRVARYFHLVERDSNKISPKWKIAHLLIYLAIAITSTVSTYAFSEIFDSFNYRCILYAKPYFVIDKIVYFNETEEADSDVTINLMQRLHLRDDDDASRGIAHPNHKLQRRIIIEDWSAVEYIPNTEYCILNNIIYFKNDSLYGQVDMKMMKTVFATLLMCNYTLFIPLLSLVIASVSAGIVILFGRGGRGSVADTIHQGWRYVYVILIISTILFIQFIVATNFANHGLKMFCQHFVSFTGYKNCNPYMNYFTFQTRTGFRPFYTDYLITYYSYILNTMLWAAQLILTICRILVLTDFQFNTVLVKVTRKKDRMLDDEEEEILWNISPTPKFYSVYEELWGRYIESRDESYKKA